VIPKDFYKCYKMINFSREWFITRITDKALKKANAGHKNGHKNADEQ